MGLAMHGERATDVVQVLVDVLDEDRLPSVIAEPVQVALAKIGRPSLGPLERLIEGTPRYSARFNVRGALEKMTNLAEPALALLLRLLEQPLEPERSEHERGTDRWSSEEAMANLGLGAVAPLSRALSHQRPEVRASVARALGRMGKVAAPATPALRAALKKEKTPETLRAIEEALQEIAAASAKK
jgi:hypothetical protein